MIAAAAGAAVAMALPRPGWCFLAWIAVAPLIALSLDSKSSKEAARRGLVFGLSLAGVAFYWIYLTCRFAGVAVPVSLAAWAGLSLLMALPWAAFAAAFRGASAKRQVWLLPFVAGAIFAAIEFAISNTPLGLHKLAYTQWRYLSVLQPISVVGPFGLGFLLIAWNAALAVCLIGKAPRKDGYKALAVVGTIALAWVSYGRAAWRPAQDESAGKRLAIIQPNIDQYQKWDPQMIDSIKGQFDAILSYASAFRPAMIVWPESAAPGWLDQPRLRGWMSSWARRSQAAHIIGVIRRDPEYRNSAAFFNERGELVGMNDKRILVPFGEFVPLRSLLEPLAGILGEMGDFESGAWKQPAVETPVGRVGATLCFEAVFPSINRQIAAQGAAVIVNLTNDGWYKDTWGPYQHFYSNRFRAIENRATVVRAANTGISGVFDPFGNVVTELGIDRGGFLNASIGADLFPRRSFYARTGEWFGWLCVFFSGILMAGKLKIK